MGKKKHVERRERRGRKGVEKGGKNEMKWRKKEYKSMGPTETWTLSRTRSRSEPGCVGATLPGVCVRTEHFEGVTGLCIQAG